MNLEMKAKDSREQIEILNCEHTSLESAITLFRNPKSFPWMSKIMSYLKGDLEPFLSVPTG